jgi:asparagine synthase (glutamine-hydrolysing)
MQKMKKRGFPVPLATWLRTELYGDVRAVLQSPYARPFINQELALKMCDDHQKGRQDLSRPLWTIVIFILWVEQKMVFND